MAPTPARSGSTGEQSRSLLAFGGDGGSDGAVQIHEGDEYTFAFSFYIQSMSYGEPGADNVILQFMSDASDTRTLGLQLWQDGIADPLNSGRGLWASGDAMGGDRFLAPLAERTWHDVTIRFRASSQGDGFYILSLDGQLLDARGEISLIAPGSTSAQIEVGLLRDSTRGPGNLRNPPRRRQPGVGRSAEPMRAMVLERQREPLRPAELPDSGAGRRAGPDLGLRLRRLPHRPPHRRRRSDRAEAAAGARAPDRRRGRRAGEGAERFAVGERVGVPWLGWTDGECRYCLSGRENLCDRARFTGYDIDGGYAELAVADERYCFPIPERLPRRAGGAAALRGADRLPGAAPGRRRRAGRLLRLRRLGPHPLPGRRPPGPAGLRLHPRGRRRGPGVRPRASAPSGRAPRRSRRRRSSTGRSSSPRSAR